MSCYCLLKRSTPRQCPECRVLVLGIGDAVDFTPPSRAAAVDQLDEVRNAHGSGLNWPEPPADQKR